MLAYRLVVRVGDPAPGVVGCRETHDDGAWQGPFAFDYLGLQAAPDNLSAVPFEYRAEAREVFSEFFRVVDIKLGNHIHNETGQMVWRQNITQADLQVKRFLVIGGSEFSGHVRSLHQDYPCLDDLTSPTNC